MSDITKDTEYLVGSAKAPSIFSKLRQRLSSFFGRKPPSDPFGKLTPQLRAQLLYDYCIASEKKVSESVHSFFIMAEHYSSENPDQLECPQGITGVPPFFAALSPADKAKFCYNQVVEALSLEAMPVTVESLRATKRSDPDDPWSSYAGRFVRHVTWWVMLSLVAMVAAYFVLDPYFHFFEWKADNPDKITEGMAMQWVAFGCMGALIHLLNHALTATRLQTFEVSEARKIGPRLLLGGMFGFVVPWILSLIGLPEGSINVTGSVAAFFGGYSVRFSIGLLERLLAALMPETNAKA